MSKQLPVTDHAVLRYLECVAGVDVEAIRQRIHKLTRHALASGATGITANGISYRIRTGRVRTVWLTQTHIRPLDWSKDSK